VGPDGGSGLSVSFRNRGFGPDPGGKLISNFDFDLKYSWEIGILRSPTSLTRPTEPPAAAPAQAASANTQLYLRTLLILILAAPSRGRVRTVIFLRRSTVLARFRPGPGG
jgi:hypothetical protein